METTPLTSARLRVPEEDSARRIPFMDVAATLGRYPSLVADAKLKLVGGALSAAAGPKGMISLDEFVAFERGIQDPSNAARKAMAAVERGIVVHVNQERLQAEGLLSADLTPAESLSLALNADEK
jgi:hypothetical protein